MNSPQSNPIVNFRGDGLTLEKVVSFCEYSIVNMIIDQLKHLDGREDHGIKQWNVWRELLEIRAGLWLEHRAELLDSQWKDRFFCVDNQISTK